MRSRSGVRSDGVGPAAPASCFSGLSGRRILRLPGNAQGDHSMRWLLSKRGRSIPMTDLWAVGPVSIKSVSRIFLLHLQQFHPTAKADWKRDVLGKSVSERVDTGGGRIIKKK